MIELKNITKKYDSTILDNISFNFCPGNIYVIKGISGSGKTTLLNLIANLDTDYDGDILVNNKKMKNFSKKEKNLYLNNIGYMMQKSALFASLTIQENLLLINKDKKLIDKYLKLFNLANILNKYPNEISGGERQRVSFIRLLLNNNKIILLDEATSNLDKNNSFKFVSYLKKIDKTDKIIIISTHKDIFDDIADIILNIKLGKIVSVTNKKEQNNFKLEFSKNSVKRNIFVLLKKRIKQSLLYKLIIISMILILLFSLSARLNFKTEYIKNKIKKHPYLVVDLKKEYLNTYSKFIDKTYDFYYYEDENNKVFPLFDKSDSNLKNYIDFGVFPTKSNEVLINTAYYEKYFNNIDKKSVVNKKIVIKNKEYVIKGILSNDKEVLPLIYNTNSYYETIYGIDDTGLENDAIFMNINELKLIGSIKNTLNDDIMVKLKEDYLFTYYDDNLEKYPAFLLSNAIGQYSINVYKMTTNINSITKASIICVITLICISSLFLINQINLELYYRQKEMGYLLLWHYSKDDVGYIITLSYIFEFIINLFIAVIIYFILSILLLKIYDFNLFIAPKYIILVLFSYLIFIYFIISIPLNKYLKKDILQLLK